MISNDVDKISEIGELLDMGKENSLTLQNTNIKAINSKSNLIYPIQNILREVYRPMLLRYSRTVTLNDINYAKYRYNPKKLSYDLYGGVELWHLLLWLNNMISVTQFNTKRLIVFSPDSLNVLNRILENESDNIRYNSINPITEYDVKSKVMEV